MSTEPAYGFIAIIGTPIILLLCYTVYKGIRNKLYKETAIILIISIILGIRFTLLVPIADVIFLSVYKLWGRKPKTKYICGNCGSELGDGANVCSKCGYRVRKED